MLIFRTLQHLPLDHLQKVPRLAGFCIPQTVDNDRIRASGVLYDELNGQNEEQEPQPLGKAVHRAREAIASFGDATWLSYAVYGHPLARAFYLP